MITQQVESFPFESFPRPEPWYIAASTRHQLRREVHARLRARAAEAYTSLRNELITALLTDPETDVRTPGYCTSTMTAAAIVDDLAAGDLEILPELLRIVAWCAKGELDHETHLRASAWVAKVGAAHAKFHAGDLEEQMLSEAA